jgi:pimeloyl-ACP methyl ester carboxylesterase
VKQRIIGIKRKLPTRNEGVWFNILLREKDVKNFNNPVYMIVSDNDVFFPGLESIDRAKRIFNNFREAHILKNSKHMPNKEDYFEIQQKIKLWLEE